MSWENLIFMPFVGFIQWPLAALVPAGLFALAFWVKRIPLLGATSALWALYAIYESLMKARVLCSGECNIRVDLLLISPALWILSIVAAVKFFRKKAPNGAA